MVRGKVKGVTPTVVNRDERATIREVAKLAKVSRATVTRAFEVGQKTSIKSDTRDRVMAAAAALNYRPSPSAQNLKSRKSRSVGMPVIGSVEPKTGVGQVTLQLGDMLAGSNSILRPVGYRVEPLFFDTWAEACEALPAMYRAGFFDAIFVPYPNALITKCARVLAEAGCLIVSTEFSGKSHPKIQQIRYANISNLSVVDEVVRQGRKLIVFTEVEITTEMRSKYSKELSSGNVRFVSLPTPRDSGDHPLLQQFVETLLSEFPDVDAVLTPDEFIGWGIFMELRKRGIQVPNQITLSGAADVRHPFKPLPILQLLYAPGAINMRLMATELLRALAKEEVFDETVKIPSVLQPPTPRILVMSKTEFAAAAAAELRSEKLLMEVEAELLGQTATR